MNMIRHNFGKFLDKMNRRVQDFSKPLKEFYVYLLRETGRTFKALGKGGTFRGVTWPWFAPIKIRSQGRTREIPAYGIPGKYLGRLRPSGKRVGPNSKVVQDTGLLRRGAMSQFSIGTHIFTAGTPGEVAEIQQKMRPFVFINLQDVQKLNDMLVKHIVRGDDRE